MRRVFGFVATLAMGLAATYCAPANQVTSEFSVQVSAAVAVEPPRIVLSWPRDGCVTPNGYTVYRKAPEETRWGRGTPVPAAACSFVDSNVITGVPYEYQVVKSCPLYSAYGYVETGIEI